MNRRDFIQQSALATGLLLPSVEGFSQTSNTAKRRVAMVGTGSRGTGMWGRSVAKRYAEQVEFVGLCDINPGRVETVKKYMEVSCPTFTDFEKMMRETKPETLIVTTVDATHHEFIIKGMEMGANIITEKPMTTDERKCQAILEAERRTGKKVTVTFNYRYSPHRQKLYELLRQGVIGDLVSVDFHWYLDIHHGADYFRRWHAYKEKSGTLFVHKATHHFDLLNWWLESEPEEVFAYGALEHYGKNGAFRGKNCRTCPHQKECKFYYDISKNREYMGLYVANEQHDGYLRDGCVFREDINIYDKMAASIRYANGVTVSYSLTTYSPYEGYRIAFNGKKGRLEAWIQESSPEPMPDHDELVLTENFGKITRFKISNTEGGHGGGDDRLKDKIFKDPTMPDPFRQSAGVRDGAMSILVGIAARNSVEQQRPIKIADLTELKPMAKRP
ncbi:MAG: Gfo/Idh/MocA family oxidoreductase [Spirosomaceae bacterium]|jgi:predicted dehydrogenase|nr:Gfo/Idh/MocA family oxidoreductase [Spirosomataceae bacterium]